MISLKRIKTITQESRERLDIKNQEWFKGWLKNTLDRLDNLIEDAAHKGVDEFVFEVDGASPDCVRALVREVIKELNKEDPEDGKYEWHLEDAQVQSRVSKKVVGEEYYQRLLIRW